MDDHDFEAAITAISTTVSAYGHATGQHRDDDVILSIADTEITIGHLRAAVVALRDAAANPPAYIEDYACPHAWGFYPKPCPACRRAYNSAGRPLEGGVPGVDEAEVAAFLGMIGR